VIAAEIFEGLMQERNRLLPATLARQDEATQIGQHAVEKRSGACSIAAASSISFAPRFIWNCCSDRKARPASTQALRSGSNGSS